MKYIIKLLVCSIAIGSVSSLYCAAENDDYRVIREGEHIIAEQRLKMLTTFCASPESFSQYAITPRERLILAYYAEQQLCMKEKLTPADIRP